MAWRVGEGIAGTNFLAPTAPMSTILHLPRSISHKKNDDNRQCVK